jgi:hypothetical protein
MRIIAILLFGSLSLFSQQHQAPCKSPESSQFDFWLGEWECSWKDAKGETKKGSNKINKILGSCVIEENFNGNPGSPLVGKSHSLYSIQQGKWFQTWVDNNGSYLDFKGGKIDDKMILSREVKLKIGTSFIQRMVCYNITDNEFDWNWERSDDNGKTWNVRWQLKYKRKKS